MEGKQTELNIKGLIKHINKLKHHPWKMEYVSAEMGGRVTLQFEARQRGKGTAYQ